MNTIYVSILELEGNVGREIVGTAALNQYASLLDQCFPVPTGHHYFDDFPIWDPRFKVVDLYRTGIFSGTRLLSCAGVRLADLGRPNGCLAQLRIALLGGVATHPEYARRGLGSRAVSAAVDWAVRGGAQMILLWGSEHRMYERLGFQLYGKQLQISLADISTLRLSPTNPRVHIGWNPRLFQLRQGSPTGLLLKDQDCAWYSAHKNVQWFYVGEPDRPEAYAAVGRGIDLPGVVHEWGIHSSVVHRSPLPGLLRYIEEGGWARTIIGSPSLLAEIGVPPRWPPIEFPTEFLCLARMTGDRAEIEKVPLWIWGLDAV